MVTTGWHDPCVGLRATPHRGGDDRPRPHGPLAPPPRPERRRPFRRPGSLARLPQRGRPPELPARSDDVLPSSERHLGTAATSENQITARGFRARSSNRGRRHGFVEGRQPSTMRHRKREEVDVGQLARSQQLVAIHDAIVEQTDVVRKKPVMGRRYGRLQARHRFGYAQRVRIPRLGDDPHAAVLRQRAGCPSPFDLTHEPLRDHRMMCVVLVEQGNQHVDVEQGAHGSRSPAPRAAFRRARW